MSECLPVRAFNDIRLTAAAAVVASELWQVPGSGEAAYFKGLSAAASGDRIGFETRGQVAIPKTNGIAILDGGRVYWDASASAGHYKKVNDRDFYAGRAVGDAASGDLTMTINLNIDPSYDIDMLRDGCHSVPTGTQAVGAFGFPKVLGGSRLLELTATNEAQCIDMLSVDRFSHLTSNFIAEFIVRIPVNGSGAAVDFSAGVANGTSTTDADAITEHLLFHIDGGDLSIFAQSKDGTTTVAATDTTVDATAGSAVANRQELWIDGRDPANVKLYVNGVRVLSGSTFVLSAAAGPLGLLFHLEKTTGTTTGQFILDAGRCRYAEQ